MSKASATSRPPAALHDRGCNLGRGDQPVWFVLLPGRQDILGVAARHGQAGLADLVIAPPQLVAKAIAIEAQARVEVWHRAWTASTFCSKDAAGMRSVSQQ